MVGGSHSCTLHLTDGASSCVDVIGRSLHACKAPLAHAWRGVGNAGLLPWQQAVASQAQDVLCDVHASARMVVALCCPGHCSVG